MTSATGRHLRSWLAKLQLAKLQLARSPLVQWCVIASLLLFYAAATHRLSFLLVPDSLSYLDYPFESLDAALRSIRTPAYPLLLRVVDLSLGIAAMPIVHCLLHASAAFMLVRELTRWGTPAAACWAAGLAVAFGCTPLDNLAIISTDSVAASVGVMVAVSLVRWVRLELKFSTAVSVALLAILSIAIRPAYLAILPWVMFTAVILLCRHSTAREPIKLAQAIRSALALGAMILLPIIGWIVLRGVVVNDFGLLPFGHQNLAGITIQLATDDELLATDGEAERLAREIVEQKKELLKRDPSLVVDDPHATMTIETRWDSYVWYAVVPAANSLYPNDTIASHQVVKELNRDLIGRFPLRYARWIALAARRAAWGTVANIVMQPIFLLCIVVAIGLEFARAFSGLTMPVAEHDDGLNVLFMVAITYFICLAGFVILTSPPLGRFADAAGIFIPAWVAARLTLYFRGIRSARPARCD